MVLLLPSPPLPLYLPFLPSHDRLVSVSRRRYVIDRSALVNRVVYGDYKLVYTILCRIIFCSYIIFRYILANLLYRKIIRENYTYIDFENTGKISCGSWNLYS